MNLKEDFFDFYDRRRDQKENIWRSFTKWSALYDYMKNRSRGYNNEYSEIWNAIEQSVSRQYAIQLETVEQFSYDALLELCDISELDEICNYLFFNEEEDETTN